MLHRGVTINETSKTEAGFTKKQNLMNYMKMGGPTKMFGVGGLFMKQNAYVLKVS